MKIAIQNEGAGGLESKNFGNCVSEYSIEKMLQQGLIVKITAWVRAEMGFAASDIRVHAAMTVGLWKMIVSVPEFCWSWQSIRGRGDHVMWIAAWALRHARVRGTNLARFQAFLPVSDNDERPEKGLRVETIQQADRHWVVIGLCEEFSISLP